jgi:2-polyprenyl-3-methyl-5-hydroxy-6-metoxy-1,4-benzoquinol methylase
MAWHGMAGTEVPGLRDKVIRAFRPEASHQRSQQVDESVLHPYKLHTREEKSRQSARVIAELITRLVRPRSVLDVGCGQGLWLTAFQELGATEILGVDGAYVTPDILRIPYDRFFAADLNAPLQLKRSFDLTLSIEVAEHLPDTRAPSFVRDLTSRSPCVLFSAAIPFQGGHEHINEQWQDYWADLFATENFRAIDCVRPFVWSDPRVAYFYAQNVLLYVSEDRLAVDTALQAAYERTKEWPLRIVHPWKYLSVADITGIPLRRVLGWMPTLVRSGWRRTITRRSLRPAKPK